MVKISRFMLAAALALAANRSRAAEEYSPLVPPAFSPVSFGEGGAALRRVSSTDPAPEIVELPDLGRNVVRLSLPLPPNNPETKLRMMEASPAGPGGALQFKPSESMPGTLHASIPGLVPPEVLVMSRMERGKTRGARSGGGFAPISLPLSLGTEELPEFDPNAVQEAFPAAARGGGQTFAGWPFEDNGGLRPGPSNAGAAEAMPPLPELPVGVEAVRAAGTARRGVMIASAPVAEPAPLRTLTAGKPPKPEAGRESLSGTLRPESLSPPELLERALAFSDPADGSGGRETGSGGFLLPLPPMEAMSPGAGREAPARGAENSVRAEEGLKQPERAAGRRRRPAKLKGASPPLQSNEFTPMRGVRVY